MFDQLIGPRSDPNWPIRNESAALCSYILDTRFSLVELNRAIRELLLKLNQHPFKKREGSRQSVFAELDRPALRPLPTQRFELAAVWAAAKVNIDYHIQFDAASTACPIN